MERIDGHTGLFGIFATPIKHSLSPKMHNNAFAKLGLNDVYLAFEVGQDQLANAVQSMRTLHMRGANISMPNKQAIVPLLDKLSPAAQLTGTVNTVVNDHGVLTGHITDGTGFMQALRDEGLNILGAKMVLAGAGGAGTAIAIQAALDGVGEIAIFNRRSGAKWSQACKNVELINHHTKCQATLHALEDQSDFKQKLASADIYCDTTSLGMKPHENESVVNDPAWFHKQMIVFDAVYAPRETKLLKVAKQAGVAHRLNGIGMIIEQGAEAFQLWTGKQMPVDYIRHLLFEDDQVAKNKN